MKRKNRNTKAEKKFKEKIKKKLTSEEKDIKDIWRRIRKRDFSGNTGLAIKNSVYQTLTNVVAKGGSLIFTIIVARLLLPELFGLYSLALSTIIIFAAVSELGVGQTLTRFVSRFLGKGKKAKAKAYTFYLAKIKFFLIIFSIILLLILSRFISDVIYQKPIFLALLAGAFYIIFMQILGTFRSVLIASNSFKEIFHNEIILQAFRVILVPLTVLLSLKYVLTDEKILFYVFISLSVVYLIAAMRLGIITIKKSEFLKKQSPKKTSQTSLTNLTKNEKKGANKFLIAMSAIVLSGIFFTNIDRVMLGYFVQAEFIGYYTAALSLIGGISPFLSFAALVLLPIFSRMKGKRLEIALKKSRNLIFMLSIAIFIFILLFAPIIISIVYGSAYAPAINILRLFSLLLIFLSLGALYQTYYISQGKPKKIAKLLIISTILNIFLNYILITSLLPYGHLAAVYGASIATIISKGFFLGGLILRRKKK